MTNPQTSTRRNFALIYRLAVTALALAASLGPAREARAQTSTLSNGLVSHWKLDEATGARSDSVGTNHLADNNAVTQAAGKLGGAAEFTVAAGKHLSQADNASLSVGDIDFTFAGWFYLTSKSSYMGLFGKDDAAGIREYSLYYDQPTDRIVWMVFGPSDAAAVVHASTLASPPLNQWLFIAVWHDSVNNTINIQVNNGAVNSSPHSAGVKDSVSAFKVGQALAGNGLNGRIDSFSFWKRALTAGERAELYNNGAGKDPTGGGGATTPPGGELWQQSGANIFYNAGNVGIGPGMTNPQKTLDVIGTINATGAITGGTISATYQDVAEWVPSTQRLAAGSLVVLDPARTNHVLASTRPYDTGVAGVISPQPGIILGEGGEGKVLVATTGRVRVRVDATRGPVRVGDLLVTSGVPGVAMKSVPVRVRGVKMHRPGTIVGKALEPLGKGTGEILVLLSLQ